MINFVVQTASFFYYLVLFYRFQVKNRFESLVGPVIGSFLVFGIFLWISSGGLTSAIPYLLLVGMLVSIVLVQQSYRALTAIIFLSVQLLLVIFELVFSVEWLPEPTDSALKAVPFIYLLCAVTVAYLAYHLKTKFDEERDLLRQQSEDLFQKNKLIDRHNQIMKQINQLLEQKVAERTASLEQLNQQLTEYAYYNSHNIRGPLSRIMGLTMLLKDGDQDQDGLLKELCVASNELDDAIKRINRILDVKTPEESAGSSVSPKTEFNRK